MAHGEHKGKAKAPVNAWVLTCSDSRTPDTDESGKLMCDLIRKEGHTLTGYEIVSDDPDRIHAAIARALESPATQVIMINGGTGISRRDSTYEVVAGLLDKRIDGFGELFRMISYREIGSSAMMSRAVAGVCRDRVILSVPGSLAAVRLAMEELILPEIRHMAWLLKS